MNDKTVYTLGAVAGVMVLASFLVGSRGPTVDFGFTPGQYLIKNLDTASVAGIRIKGKEEEVKLDRNGNTFVVTSKLSYPAANKEVNTLMRDLIKVQLAGEETDSPAAFAGLGVAEDSEDAKVVKFLDNEGNEIVGVVIGKNVEGGSGYYVRRTNDNQVYRTDAYLYVRDRSVDYVDKEIVNVERDKTAKVEVMPAGSTPYTIVKPEEGEIALEGIPEGKRAKGKTYESVFTAASYLNFTDFKPATEMSDLEFGSTYKVTDRAGAEYTFQLAKKTTTKEPPKDGEPGAEPTEETKWYLRGTARYTGPAQVTISKDDPDEELKKKEAHLQAQDAVKAFNQLHPSWVYEVSSWKAENMAKPFADLVEDIPAGPEEIEARHILITFEGSAASEAEKRSKEDARKLAEEVLAKVQAAPADFAKLADEYTEDPSGKGKGGDLGTFKRETMTKPFSDAAFSLEVDQVSDIVETEFGFHIIQRTK